MTVRYVSNLADPNSYYGCFFKLLLKWQGSVYKLIWKEYVAFLSAYYAISFIYLVCLDEESQRFFEKLCRYFNSKDGAMPMSFVLGFFVTAIVQNWWKLYNMIPWPDSMAHILYAGIRKNDENSKLLRKSILRYTHLSLGLTLREISPAYKSQYPKLSDFVSRGLLEENERKILEKERNILESEKQKLEKEGIQVKLDSEWNSILPITWATDLVMGCDSDFKTKMFDELNSFRKSCTALMDYEICSVPLVYTQVVTISLYTYFVVALLGKQWLVGGNPNVLNLYFPLFTSLQFIFLMGWFKVAEALMNPFGDDDVDFELHQIMERHIRITNLIVDTPSASNDGDKPTNGTVNGSSDVKLVISHGKDDSTDRGFPDVFNCLQLMPPTLNGGNHCVNIEDSSISGNMTLDTYCGGDAEAEQQTLLH